jgi:hypothetical protein
MYHRDRAERTDDASHGKELIAAASQCAAAAPVDGGDHGPVAGALVCGGNARSLGHDLDEKRRRPNSVLVEERIAIIDRFYRRRPYSRSMRQDAIQQAEGGAVR